MATAMILPKLGNSVESSIIVRWLKNAGARVAEGEPVCEIETDKTTIEVPSPASGVLSLRRISREAARLAQAGQAGRVAPDELTGGTFTVTNLGSLGVESFTPLLNPPQVAILGVGGINLKPVEVDGEVRFISHINLSLTINHQVVDGAPGARFLQSLARNLAELDLLLAL